MEWRPARIVRSEPTPARPRPGRATVPQIGIIRAFASYVSGWTGSYRHTGTHSLEKRIPQFLSVTPADGFRPQSAREKSAERGTSEIAASPTRNGRTLRAPGKTRAGERRGKRISPRTHARPTFVHLSDDEYTHIDVVVTKDEIACRRGREQRTAHEKRRSQEAGRAGEASHRCRHGVP